jgi:hypothetical protein
MNEKINEKDLRLMLEIFMDMCVTQDLQKLMTPFIMKYYKEEVGGMTRIDIIRHLDKLFYVFNLDGIDEYIDIDMENNYDDYEDEE